MAHKQQFSLHELLKQEQEPFHLKTYIANRRSQIRKPTSGNALQVKKRKPIFDSASTMNSKRSSICRNACFFSFQNSPDVRKSPLIDFRSTGKSPCMSPNRAVFLHILEAAVRIQTKQSKREKQEKDFGFGSLFGSIVKGLKGRAKNRRRMLGVDDNMIVERFSRRNELKIDEKIETDSCNYISRLRSTGWSSSNEEKSMDLETSTSNHSEETEKRFCSSPFRFSLQKSPSSSSGHPTPDFTSPAASPSHRRKGEKANYVTRVSEKVTGEGDEEEEKEQCSPVSVLDPPFEEDEGNESADVGEDDGYDLDCSYENVQRAKQQLLYRLHRFEKLAELDPMELERKLLKGSDDDEQEDCKDEIFEIYRDDSDGAFVPKVFSFSNLISNKKNIISTDMRRLASDHPTIEQKNEMNLMNNCQVVFDAVDMISELAFKQETESWMKFQEQEEETATEIEVSIFGLLVEELSEELCY